MGWGEGGNKIFKILNGWHFILQKCLKNQLARKDVISVEASSGSLI